jgi:ribosomal protein L32
MINQYWAIKYRDSLFAAFPSKTLAEMEKKKFIHPEYIEIIEGYFVTENELSHNTSLKRDKLSECQDCAKWLNQNKYCRTCGRTKPLAP